ncbi:MULTISPECIES: EutP/PduV family microcompartment system protein [Enterococcus]|uniref:EutP/PduV family microcompartment system protein n=1 Tax=Candidatus Enterococcus murrayae TaxID=2815321 RepID=A0ABS3HQA6_9ENTE|nr:EutP/PduV family microcompartment system protein [Enterococcus sp. MJM16]MBO0454788.1 EutP/PduV family microcompartment system protein [Enterococcus sp. MJM16]
MKRVIFIGETGSGKTTLMQILNDWEIKYHKTQQVYFTDNVIDTPGEFMENRFYYNALVSSAVEADCIALVQSIASKQNYFPPCFSSRFTKPMIGIITKTDLEHSPAEFELAQKRLRLAGAKKIFSLSSINKSGITDLKEFLLTNEF